MAHALHTFLFLYLILHLVLLSLNAFEQSAGAMGTGADVHCIQYS